MDPDVFITVAFCMLIFGIVLGAGAVLARRAGGPSDEPPSPGEEKVRRSS